MLLSWGSLKSFLFLPVYLAGRYFARLYDVHLPFLYCAAVAPSTAQALVADSALPATSPWPEGVTTQRCPL